MKTKLNAFVLSMALLIQPIAYAGFDEGASAYKKGNYQAALKEFKPLAEQGNVDAQFSLGMIYRNGQGVTQDYIMSHKWFNIAGANGDAEAAKSRNIVEKLMTPQQVEKAQQLARDWVPQYGK